MGSDVAREVGWEVKSHVFPFFSVGFLRGDNNMVVVVKKIN